MFRREWAVLLVTTGAVAAVGVVAFGSGAGAKPRAQAAYKQICASEDTSPRNPANPLNTVGFTGTDPLNNAHFFVESPWLNGGDAAKAIAKEVGLGYLAKQYRGTPIPWAQFKARVNRMHLSRAKRFRVNMLEKIGDYPQAHQFSDVTAGGTGNAIYTQVQYYLCRMHQTDPAASAVITTYFVLHHGCASGDHSNFKPEVNGLKAAVGNFSALIFVEEDGVDTTCWKNAAAVRGRARLLKYEIDQLSQLPHALLYVEAGASDANSVDQAVGILSHADVHKIRGFFLNDTHFAWSYKEIKFGNQISRRLGGLHFVIDTRANGNGPKLNPDPVHQGLTDLCNPPGRGIGPKPVATNGRSYGRYSKWLDGFVWVTTPGESANKHCPGKPRTYAPGGIFDPWIGIGYASRANDRIGPTPPYKSRPW